MNLTSSTSANALGTGAAAGGGMGVGLSAMRNRDEDEPRPSFQSYENNAPVATVSDLLSNGRGYDVVPQHVS